jgi:putative flippase GtrA
MIRRELAIFLIVGILTVLFDFLSYRSLIRFDVFDTNMAKAIGFLIGTLFAYFANRFWTFGDKPHQPGSAWRFTILYASTLGTNVLVNSLMLKLFVNTTDAIQLAFLIATWVSACLNFLGMKLFVFRRHTSLETL